jgi:hypothetical protein
VTPTITPTQTATPTVTPTVTPTISVTPTVTPTTSVTPTVSVTPSGIVDFLFKASFDALDGTLLTDYTPEVPAGGLFGENYYTADIWAIENNSVTKPGTGSTAAVWWTHQLNSPLPDSYSFECKFAGFGSSTASACPGFILCAENSVTTSGRACYFARFAQNGLEIEKISDGGSFSQVAFQSITINTSQIYTFRADISPTQLEFFVDGVPILTLQDTEYRGGGFGYRAGSTTNLPPDEFLFDDMIVFPERATEPIVSQTNFTVSPVSDQALLASWDPIEDATSYELQRSNDGNEPWTTIYVGTGTSYEDTGRAAATKYYYRWRASNAVGDSDWILDSETTNPIGAPATPTGVTAVPEVGNEENGITVSWDQMAGTNDYVIARSLTGAGDWVQSRAVQDGPSPTITYDGLDPSTTNYFRISARNASGNSPYAFVNATTSGTTGVPSIPVAGTATGIGPSTIRVTWTDSNGTTYEVDRSDDGVSGWSVIATGISSGTEFYNDSSGLSEDTIYYYRVRAINGTGTSGASDIMSGSTTISTGLPPGGIVENALDGSATAKLQWNGDPEQGDPSTFLPSDRGEFTFPAPWNTTGVRLTNNKVQYPSVAQQARNPFKATVYGYFQQINAHGGQPVIRVFAKHDHRDGMPGNSIIEYNKTTGAVSDPLPCFNGSTIYRVATAIGDPFWSKNDPDIMYWSYAGMALRGNFSTIDGTNTLDASDVDVIFDATTLDPSYTIFAGQVSGDDRWYAGTLKSNSTGVYRDLGTIVIDMVNNQHIVIPKVRSESGAECNLDTSGRWLLIKEDITGQFEYDNRIFDLSVGISDGGTALLATEKTLLDQNGAGGHMSLGDEYLVNNNNFGPGFGSVELWDFREPATSWDYTVHATRIGNVAVSGAPAPNHQSFFNCQPRSVKPISEQFCMGNGATTPAPSVPFSSEIFCIPCDESFNYLSCCPVMTKTDGVMGYYNSLPKACIDYYGEWVLWSSNLGTTEHDLFLVRIPYQKMTNYVP